ncbi:MAG: IS110 family transposase, partial [Victivallaceae bacterium]
DPKAVKDFIGSLKLRNKTDKTDAGALARYGAERMPEPFQEMPEDYQYLQELTRQRSALQDQLTAAEARLSEIRGFKKLAKIQQGVVKSIGLAVKKMELEIKRCVNDSKELSENVKFRLPDPWKKVLLGFQPLDGIGVSIS